MVHPPQPTHPSGLNLRLVAALSSNPAQLTAPQALQPAGGLAGVAPAVLLHCSLAVTAAGSHSSWCTAAGSHMLHRQEVTTALASKQRHPEAFLPLDSTILLLLLLLPLLPPATQGGHAC